MKTKNPPRALIQAFWASAVAILIILLLSSCYTQKKATRQVTRAQSEFPEIVAKSCAAGYPVRAFDSVRVEYRAGKTVYDTAWVTVDCDSALQANKVERWKGGKVETSTKVRVPCPPSEKRTDTFYTSHSRVEENTALIATKDTAIARLQVSLSNAKAKEAKTASGRNAWRIVALISLFLIVATVAVRLWRPKLIS